MKRGYIRPGFFDEQKLVSKNSAITIKENCITNSELQYKHVSISQSEYNSLPVKDTNTFYYVY